MDKIKTIETGKRYLQITSDGTLQTIKKKQAKKLAALDTGISSLIIDPVTGKIDIEKLNGLNGKRVH